MAHIFHITLCGAGSSRGLMVSQSIPPSAAVSKGFAVVGIKFAVSVALAIGHWFFAVSHRFHNIRLKRFLVINEVDSIFCPIRR